MKSRILKYVIWVPWFTAIVAMLCLHGVKKVDPLAYTTHGISVTELHGYVILYFLLALILTLALVIGRRSFCHHVCWMAPFLVLGDKTGRALRIPSLHLDARREKCNGCGLCSQKCPMSLPVDKMVSTGNMNHTDCILCGECVDGCKRDAIGYKFGCTPEHSHRLRAQTDEPTGG